MNQFQDEKAKLLEALVHESHQPQNNELQKLKDKVQSMQAHANFDREFRLLVQEANASLLSPFTLHPEIRSIYPPKHLYAEQGNI